uniref:Poly [ADP-ribose] polymerase n=1 Tax=Syphacia muris TaxID=451379 RepID=A0A158R496_9BILA
MTDAAPAKQLPFAAEYAKSGRACCKACHTNIPQGSLRMAIRTPSHFFDGLQDNWCALIQAYHFRCFWPRIKKNEINEASIRGMDFLKWSDQEEIRAKIVDNKVNGADSSISLRLKIEYAKSARGKCAGCKNMIGKGIPRIGLRSTYYHVDCFKKSNESLVTDITGVDGFHDLRDDDKKLFKSTFNHTSDKRKRKKEGAPEEPPKRLKEDKKPAIDGMKKKLLQEQADRIWSVRKCLEDNLNNNGLKTLLEYNGQEPSKHNVLEQVLDCIIFGCPNKCERCGGQVVFSMSQQTYKCMGYATAYTKCTYTSKNPGRKKFVFPENMLKEIKQLSKIKSTAVRDRVYCETGEEILKPKTFGFKSPAENEDSNEKKQKQVMKDGAVVDPDCECADEVHVWKDNKGKHWQATLGSTDVATNKNSFYKLQLLKHDENNCFYLFRSWGRIGTTIGGCKTEELPLDEAKDEFKRLFLEKSGNEWKNSTNFTKVPGKLCMLETNCADEKLPFDEFAVKPGSLTKLHKSVQDVIQMIFDVASLQHTLNEFEIDTRKMPLGKLSKRQIRSAYSVLSELQEVITNGNITYEQCVDATNRFYTFVPQCFKVGQSPPLLNSDDKIKEKTKMLDELMEIQIAYSLLKTDSDADMNRDPIDVHFEKLHTEMEVLDKNSDEYKLIADYVKNTHASTHNYYRLKIVDVIRVKREGEEERFRSDLENKYLLWHGSRTTNFAGILSQGLRIAPKEAPVTGYMFGKGIYFADMVSKSANYCHVSDGRGLLLLCEVALGEMQEEKKANYIKKLKKGKSSCKGLGKTVPNPQKTCITKDGTKVPLGKPIVTDATDLTLLYNE